jgi:hypothetical protein
MELFIDIPSFLAAYFIGYADPNNRLSGCIAPVNNSLQKYDYRWLWNIANRDLNVKMKSSWDKVDERWCNLWVSNIGV